MIKSISSTGRYFHTSGGGGTNYINNYSGAQGLGNMRFNTASQQIEIYDGSSWIQLATGHATVGLDAEAIELLDWAKAKKQGLAQSCSFCAQYFHRNPWPRITQSTSCSRKVE